MSPHHPALIYKIIPASDWQAMRATRHVRPSADDVRDGFMHLSTAAQLPGTLHKHFAAAGELVVLQLASAALGADLQWEPSRDDQLFPHLYGALDMRHVEAVFELENAMAPLPAALKEAL